jgi:cell division protein FtsB
MSELEYLEAENIELKQRIRELEELNIIKALQERV